MASSPRTHRRMLQVAPAPRHEQRAMAVLRQFRLVYGSVRRHSRRIEQDSGMSGSQAWMLHELQQSPDIGVSELAERLSIHVSTASQLVDKLVQGGYVAKQRSLEDQRRVGLRLTNAGGAALRRLPHPVEGLLPAALMDLPDHALRALQRSLDALLSGMQPLDAADAAWPVITDGDRV
jgi:DNA-binding MarR family transcriptional regulator